MLYGRHNYTVEVDSEVEKRVRDLDMKKEAFNGRTWSNAEFKRLFREGVKDAYAGLRTCPKYNVCWDSFCRLSERRREFTAAGALTWNEGLKKKVEFDVILD
jgi:hypothetical protein